MAVYVDDSAIPATVPNGPVRHTSRWSHLFADSQDELHEFAARLGLRRSYFQEGKPRGDGTPSPFWHYDVTSGKRQQALALGAVPVAWRDSPRIMRERDARQAQPHGDRAKRDPGKPPELTAADRCRMADEYALDAGHAWKAGNVAKAARLVRVAAELDPSRAELWAQRQRQIQDRATCMPLAAQTAARLAAAGVTSDDPGLQQLAEHNRLRREAAAEKQADKEAGQ